MYTKKQITSAALGCVAAAMFAVTTTATAGPCLKHYQLGGTWVGATADGAVKFSYIQTPMDPLGQTAVVNLQWLANGGGLSDLGLLFGTRASEAVGRGAMIDRDSFKYTIVWYGIVDRHFDKNDPTVMVPDEIRAIYVLSGTMDFKNSDLMISQETLKVYVTNSGVNVVDAYLKSLGSAGWPYGDADANHDLLPDPGAAPFAAASFTGTIHRRVPFLAQ